MMMMMMLQFDASGGQLGVNSTDGCDVGKGEEHSLCPRSSVDPTLPLPCHVSVL